MTPTELPNSGLWALIESIAAGDIGSVSARLAESPELSRERAQHGATRASAEAWFLEEIGHYLYAGDTALHIAAAAHRADIVMELVNAGGDVCADNRRGATPLHYAADGIPGSPTWDPKAQAATIECLIGSGADPNAKDKNKATPLHRAVRARCAGATKALLDGGADPFVENNNGSTAIRLASQPTGRGGTGSPEAKAQQQEILRLLRPFRTAAADN